MTVAPTPPDALIGHTGFVGATLVAAGAYDATYNSGNIGTIAGRSFRRVVCAGVSAVKWRANLEPEADRAGIQTLIDALATVAAEHFVLISTIDVYPVPVGVDERDAAGGVTLHPYGRHRFALEQFVRQHFASHSIVRLPALFGAGLKKNALFDLMHDHRTEAIDPEARFQWYPLARLTADIETIVAARVGLINVTAEPITMALLRARFFPTARLGEPTPDPAQYDVRSIHDRLLGGRHGYHLAAADVLAAMGRFLDEAAAAR